MVPSATCARTDLELGSEGLRLHWNLLCYSDAASATLFSGRLAPTIDRQKSVREGLGGNIIHVAESGGAKWCRSITAGPATAAYSIVLEAAGAAPRSINSADKSSASVSFTRKNDRQQEEH